MKKIFKVASVWGFLRVCQCRPSGLLQYPQAHLVESLTVECTHAMVSSLKYISNGVQDVVKGSSKRQKFRTFEQSGCTRPHQKV